MQSSITKSSFLFMYLHLHFPFLIEFGVRKTHVKGLGTASLWRTRPWKASSNSLQLTFPLLLYSCPVWASLVAKLVKNTPAMWETWVQSLGWEDPLEKGKAQFSSVAQSCLNLCDLKDCSTPGLSVHRQLPEFTQTHLHWVSDAIQPSHHLSSPSPPAFSLSQHQGLFKWVSSLHLVPKYWSFSFSISPSSEYSGLIFFRISLLDLLAVQGTQVCHYQNQGILSQSEFGPKNDLAPVLGNLGSWIAYQEKKEPVINWVS